MTDSKFQNIAKPCSVVILGISFLYKSESVYINAAGAFIQVAAAFVALIIIIGERNS